MAYLAVVRGDDMFTSGLVLITPLSIEVQEDSVSGRIQVNVYDKVRQLYLDSVHVKVIGSKNMEFVSGNTDLHGIFVVDHLIKTTIGAQLMLSTGSRAFPRSSPGINPTVMHSTGARTGWDR